MLAGMVAVAIGMFISRTSLPPVLMEGEGQR